MRILLYVGLYIFGFLTLATAVSVGVKAGLSSFYTSLEKEKELKKLEA